MPDVTDAMVEAGAKAGAVTRFEARRILTAALSAGPKSEVELETTAPWRAMESAPKDGTTVIVFAPDIYGHEDEHPRVKIRTAWYDLEWSGSCKWRGSGLTSHFQPTHWMPLPLPPAQGGKA